MGLLRLCEVRSGAREVGSLKEAVAAPHSNSARRSPACARDACSGNRGIAVTARRTSGRALSYGPRAVPIYVLIPPSIVGGFTWFLAHIFRKMREWHPTSAVCKYSTLHSAHRTRMSFNSWETWAVLSLPKAAAGYRHGRHAAPLRLYPYKVECW